MKPATFAPSYAVLYPFAAEAARGCGYALAIHGTLSRDLDLIAIPWTDDAVDAETLAKAVMNAAGAYMHESAACFIDGKWVPVDGKRPSQKPHGRIAYSLTMQCGAFIDLSIMPRIQTGDCEDGKST